MIRRFVIKGLIRDGIIDREEWKAVNDEVRGCAYSLALHGEEMMQNARVSSLESSEVSNYFGDANYYYTRGKSQAQLWYNRVEAAIQEAPERPFPWNRIFSVRDREESLARLLARLPAARLTLIKAELDQQIRMLDKCYAQFEEDAWDATHPQELHGI